MSDPEFAVSLAFGYVYVVAFDSDLVKVGRSRNPKRRLSEHEKGAAVHGASITNSWVSPPHVNYGDNEALLIDFCAARTTALGVEYFRGVDFDEVAQFAASLTFDNTPPAGVDPEMAEKVRASVRAMFPGGETLRRIQAGELVCVERGTWNRYERSVELLVEMTDVLDRLGSVQEGTYKAVAFMLAAIDGHYGVSHGSKPEPRHYAAAEAVLELLDMRAPRLGVA